MKKKVLSFIVILVIVFIVVFIYRGNNDSNQRSSSVDRMNHYFQFYEERKRLHRFTSERKFRRDVEVSPGKVKNVLLQNKDTVKLSTVKRVKGNTVFVGRITAKGQSEKNQCVSEEFAVAVGKTLLTQRDEKEIFRIKNGFISSSNIGNVIFLYLEVECEGYTDYSGNLLGEAVLNIEDQIRALMPDIPKGP